MTLRTKLLVAFLLGFSLAAGLDQWPFLTFCVLTAVGLAWIFKPASDEDY